MESGAEYKKDLISPRSQQPAQSAQSGSMLFSFASLFSGTLLLPRVTFVEEFPLTSKIVRVSKSANKRITLYSDR